MGNAYEINNKMELRLIEPTSGYKWGVWEDSFYQYMDSGTSITCKILQIPKRSFGDEIFNPEIPDEENLSLFNTLNETKKGMIPFFEDNKFGYFSDDKSIVLPAIYEDGYYFEDDIAFVKINNQWGYINKQGTQYWDDDDSPEVFF